MPLGMFVFTLLYGGMTVLAGVLAYKQVQLWPTSLAVESGIFPFLLLVVTLNLAQIPLTVFAFLGGALAIGRDGMPRAPGPGARGQAVATPV